MASYGGLWRYGSYDAFKKPIPNDDIIYGLRLAYKVIHPRQLTWVITRVTTSSCRHNRSYIDGLSNNPWLRHSPEHCAKTSAERTSYGSDYPAHLRWCSRPIVVRLSIDLFPWSWYRSQAVYLPHRTITRAWWKLQEMRTQRFKIEPSNSSKLRFLCGCLVSLRGKIFPFGRTDFRRQGKWPGSSVRTKHWANTRTQCSAVWPATTIGGIKNSCQMLVAWEIRKNMHLVT